MVHPLGVESMMGRDGMDCEEGSGILNEKKKTPPRRSTGHPHVLIKCYA